MAVLGLRFCVRAFSSCGKRGPLFITVRGPLTIVASLVAEHRLQTRRLSNCGSRAQSLPSLAACGIFPDQGLNPCPLHWQADSQPLRHQGSPKHYAFKQPVVTEEIKKYLQTNENGNTMIQNLQYAAKAVLRGEFIVIQTYLQKQDESQLNNLTLHLRNQKKKNKQNPMLVERNDKDQSRIIEIAK